MRPCKTAVAVLLLLLTASACSTELTDASQTTPTTTVETATTSSIATTVPEALAATPQGTDQLLEAVAIEFPVLEPYGPLDGQHGLDWLADQAALAALEHQGTGELDLAGLPILADRVSLGLEQLGLSFTRSNTADAEGWFGTTVTVHDDASATLERWPMFPTTSTAGATAVRLQTEQAIANRVDVQLTVDVDDLTSVDWAAARSAFPSQLAAEIADAPPSIIAWSNREAQRYVPETVGLDGNRIHITTTTRSTPPSVEELPYDSGMVVANNTIEWGTISARVELPQSAGLWPAVWLLDAESCEAPGRCSGYESSAYHEIDLLEVRTQQANEAHVSLHWWDERIRSSSVVDAIGSTPLHVQLERRPGLLIWRIDGEAVHVYTGRVDSFDAGPHRSAPMHLIVNTAVGGSFAGSREIGRDGVWLGEALVPESYPSTLDATFVVSNVSVSHH